MYGASADAAPRLFSGDGENRKRNEKCSGEYRQQSDHLDTLHVAKGHSNCIHSASGESGAPFQVETRMANAREMTLSTTWS